MRLFPAALFPLAFALLLISCEGRERDVAPAPSQSNAESEVSVSPYLEAKRLIAGLESGEVPTTETLAAAAMGEHPYVRRWALWVMGEASEESPEVNKALLAGLNDDDPSIQRQAIISARMIGVKSSEFVRPAMNLLDSPDMETVWNAAVALGDLGESAAPAIPKLEALAKPSRTGLGAMRSLGKIGKPAIPTLVDLYNQTMDEGMRSEVLAAFLMTPADDPEVRAIMEEKASSEDDPDWPIAALWLALADAPPGEMGPAMTRQLKKTPSEMRMILLVLAKEILTPEDRLDMLAEFLTDEDFRARYAAALMVMDYGEEALPLVPKLLAMPESTQDRVDIWVKEFGEKAVSHVRAALYEPATEYPAAVLLAQLGERDRLAAEALMTAAEKGHNAAVSMAALSEMGTVPATIIDRLRDFGNRNDLNPTLRALTRTVQIKRGINEEENRQALLDMTRMTDGQLGLSLEETLQFKMTILPYCLGELGPGVLEELVRPQPDAAAEMVSVIAIGRMSTEHDEAAEALLPYFTHENILLRRSAINYLDENFPFAARLDSLTREILDKPGASEFLRRDAAMIQGILARPDKPADAPLVALLRGAAQSGSPWIEAAARFALARHAIETPNQIAELAALADRLEAGEIPPRNFSGVLDEESFRTSLTNYLEQIGPEAEDALAYVGGKTGKTGKNQPQRP